MAERRKVADSLSCSICLEVLRKPVTLPCGHSYCMDCINGYWDQENQKGVYSCPQCRHHFIQRPLLNRNTVLADLMVNVTEAQQAAAPGKEEIDPEGVECDFCSGKKLKAVKSCLVCLASYCATHLQPHYESAAFKRHKLVEVTASIQDKICSKHDKLLEVYCCTDEQCICLLCVMDEHKNHDTVSAAAERKKKQQQFGKKKQSYQQGIQEKERQLKQLKQNMKTLQCCRDEALDQNEKVYTEIVQLADQRRSEMKGLIRDQEKTAVRRAEALIDQLEREIGDLRKREDDLKELSLTDDHIHFLQRYKSIFGCTELLESTDLNAQLHAYFGFVTKMISDLKDKMEIMANTIEELSDKFQVGQDPKTRQELAMYTCSLSLDPHTAFENLMLSEGNKKPLYPGFMVSRGASVRILSPE
ncbi:unnamed protein product [Menidia menidia]|uniref:(Atlantic silverside) hypothetical protein n=1 Tax=Menidia menidia TaxID=238744 RepID=A0A8S4BEF4_9TELE|nr:unnamed protein product [Menidia menidia]